MVIYLVDKMAVNFVNSIGLNTCSWKCFIAAYVQKCIWKINQASKVEKFLY